MSTPVWKPGTLYPTGSLVQPKTALPPVDATITNSSFESGSTDWTLGADTAVTTNNPYVGTNALEFTGVAGSTTTIHASVTVVAGKSITATCAYQQGGASSGHNVGRVLLRWYDAGNVQIGSDSLGSAISSGSGSSYSISSVTAVAPAGAAHVAIGVNVVRDSAEPSRADAFSWNYVDAPAPAGLIFRAVQPTVGTSGSVEPVWPTVNGVQVTDNTVIWEAVFGVRITYEASPILKSGPTEPNWPLMIGGTVVDNTIKWVATTRQVTQAPNSGVVTIAAKKVFAADDDIIKFSATVNPLDWTSENDAGYLPSGLNQNGSNKTTVLNLYRANVVSFSASTFQNWQVDPDPANMSLLDSMEGIGSTFQHAAQPVAKDLFYLAALGVRTVGISAGSTNLVNGDAGMPIDPLVRAEISALPDNGYVPIGAYYPSLGQYMIAFGPNVYIYTFNDIGGVGAWSYYTFPWPIEAHALLGNYLYLRSGDAVYRVDPSSISDQAVNTEGDAFVGVNVTATIRGHYLDFGAPGVTKMLKGFDLVGSGTAYVSLGYDQTNDALFTPAYEVPGDTVPGGIIPLPLAAPSYSMQIQYSSADGPWEWLAANFYVQPFRETS